MRQSLKGVLLSGLVFPGMGQLVLGAKKRGWSLIGAAILCLGIIVTSATLKALHILDTLAQEGKPLDIQSISEAAEQASTTAGTVIFNLVFLALIGCWLYSMVDAWRIGAGQDR